MAVSVRAATPVTPRVLVFFDYACQFCYLDWPRFKRLRAEHDADLFLVPFELRPEMPEAGVPVKTEEQHSPKVIEHMKGMAAEGGLTLIFPAFVPKTHRAIALGEYARDLGADVHEAAHEAIFAAYSGRGEDIGEPAVLLAIAESFGFDVSDVELAWDEGRYDSRIHDFRHLALAMGVSATPSALVCNELFIGTRPYRILEESLERCLITPDKIELGSGMAHAAETVQPS